MTILYCLASLAVAAIICILTGTTRPWIAQFALGAMAVSSVATAGKIVTLTPGLYVSVAVGLYSMTFLLASYLREIFGKTQAIRAIWMGLIGECLFVFATQFALASPSAPFWTQQEAFTTVFSITPRIFVASVSAYLCAEFTDVHVYHALLRATGGRALWLRNNVGTITGQVVDSVIFYTVAFYGIVPDLVPLTTTTVLVKAVVALADTPIFYAVRYVASRQKKGANHDQLIAEPGPIRS